MLEEIRRLIDSGHWAAAERALAELDEGAASSAAPCDLAEVALDLGRTDLAYSALCRALDEDPEDAQALVQLEALHADRHGSLGTFPSRGQPASVLPSTGAAGGRDRSTDEEPQAAVDGEGNDPPATILEAGTGDLVRFVHLFGGREDVHARQWVTEDGKGGYSPVREPITPELLTAHLHGSLTLGVYPIRIDGTVTFFALDLDITKKALEAARGDRERVDALQQRVCAETNRLRRSLSELGFEPLVEDSGKKGRHLWIFFEQPLKATLVHRLGRRLLAHLHPASKTLSIEVFPKQGRLKEGQIGNLIKLPLGIHRASGRRAMLLDDDGAPVPNPWPRLQRVVRAPRDTVLNALDTLKEPPPAERSKRARAASTDDSGPPREDVPGDPPFSRAHFETEPELRTRRVAKGGCPPPAPTEPYLRCSHTALRDGGL